MKRFVWLLVLAAGGCVSAREHALWPAVRKAWPNVRADAVHGQGLTANPATTQAAIHATDRAIEGGIPQIVVVNWPTVEDAALQGIERRYVDREIGSVGREMLRERVVQFADAVGELVR